MASLFRPTYVRTDSETGKKVKRRLKKWYIKYRAPDGRLHRVKGYTDKEATRQKAAHLERKAARQQEGMTDPFEEHHRQPLSKHLDDFEANLRARGRTDK